MPHNLKLLAPLLLLSLAACSTPEAPLEATPVAEAEKSVDQTTLMPPAEVNKREEGHVGQVDALLLGARGEAIPNQPAPKPELLAAADK